MNQNTPWSALRNTLIESTNGGMADSDGGRQAGANFSRNIKARREAISMSQEHLADAMTARGFSFGQATVWKIESGQRGISLTEGLAIVEILGGGRQQLTLESLVQPPEADQARQTLEEAAARLAQTSAAIETSVAAYLQATQTYATAFAIAVDRTPGDRRLGAIWAWTDPQAPELIALQARLASPEVHVTGGSAAPEVDPAADDTVGPAADATDDVAAFQRSLEGNGWPWTPWRPEDFVRMEPGDGESTAPR